MPCYSYSANNVINFVGNVEIVLSYTGNGAGVHYSYSTLAWICEFPIQDQLRVYSRISAGNPETELVQGTDFTIDATNNRINLVTAQGAGTQVVIRRSTPSNRMIYKFVDGAKLTAKELNASFHQLLFLNQEKDFLAGTNIYNYYPIFKAMNVWSGGTAYIAGDFVTFGSSIYKCIQPNTGQNPVISSGYWESVNNQINSFVVLGGPNPTAFDLTNLSIGKALVWNGTAFTAQSFSSSLSTLTDVNTTGAIAGDILRYNGTQWVKVTPSIVDLTANNLLFKDRTFYNLNTTTSYTNNATSYDVNSKSFLNVFKSGTNWVLTDPPTVYHIVQKLIPSTNLSGSQDPETYFSYINSALTNLGANLSNPVKLKFFWDLGAARASVADINAGNAGTNSFQTYYWDRPAELHSILGYTPVVGGTATGILYHGVETSTELHRVSPYFYEIRNKSTGNLVSFTSKVQGYGIKSFYLSVPECYTTPLANVPARSGGAWVTLGTFANLTDQLAYLGGESPVGYTYRDYYLMGLRDMAFAAARPEVAQDALTNGTLKAMDSKARILKGVVINVKYSGLANTGFSRLEEGTNQSILWKIPRQIIYYNKIATSFAIKNTDEHNTNTTASLDLNTLRFQGYNAFQAVPGGTAFTSTHLVAGEGRGKLFKAEEYWSEWNQAWSSDPQSGANSLQYQRFNEADIDWYMWNIEDGIAPSVYPSSVGLFKINGRNPPFTLVRRGTNFEAGSETSTAGAYMFPWPYRPNQPRGLGSGVNAIGTHFFNIDANKLFSEATNFLPDPVDEYVFRIVAKKALTNFFSDVSFSKLKTAIILEHGFSDSSTFANRTAVSSLDTIFNKGTQPADKYRADSRIDKSKIKVYIKNEALETIGADTRYVITLAIQVPRLKSIGYAKVFRRLFSSGTSNLFPQRDNAAADGEIESGPWNWVDNWSYFNNTLSASGFTFSQFGNTDNYHVQNTTFGPGVFSAIPSATNIRGYLDQEWVSGRNECAVKFTRVGIPGDMWIRLSVLNTDGSLDLLDSNGFNSTATNEA